MRTTLTTLLLLLTAACGQSASDGTAPPDPPTESPAAAAAAPELEQGSWTRLFDSPLSPREGSAAAYIGGEVVFVGGYGGHASPLA